MSYLVQVEGLGQVECGSLSELKALKAELASLSLDTSEKAVPSTSEVPDDALPSKHAANGWILHSPTVMVKTTKQGNKQYRLIDGAKIVSADEANKLAGKGKANKADSNFTTFSGQLVIAGYTLNCRIAEGKLRNGSEATNIHFAESLKDYPEVRQALKATHYRFSGYLTNETTDSASTWYINTLLTIDQIQAQFS